MDRMTSATSQLLLIASRLPTAERCILKDMIILEEDSSCPSFPEMKEYEEGYIGLDVLKRTVLHKVVQFYYQFCFKQYSVLFSSYPTERVKVMVRDYLVAENKPSEMGSLVYGDIDFFSFCNVLERVQVCEGETFYDLGHGTGRAVAAATLLYGHLFSACSGIEIMPVLYNISHVAISQLKSMLSKQTIQAIQTDEKVNTARSNYLVDHAKSNISILQGDFLVNREWLSADVIFINSTCFDNALISTLSALIIGHVKCGSRVITLTKPLTPHTTDQPPPAQDDGLDGESQDNWIEMFDKRQLVMSWGAATVYFHLIHSHIDSNSSCGNSDNSSGDSDNSDNSSGDSDDSDNSDGSNNS